MIRIIKKEFIEEGNAVFEKKVSVLGVPLFYSDCVTSSREAIKQLSPNMEVSKIKGFGNELGN